MDFNQTYDSCKVDLKQFWMSWKVKKYSPKKSSWKLNIFSQIKKYSGKGGKSISGSKVMHGYFP